ncbi:PREDICTED: uncharacterized protein LOC109184989 [Ipomoea nil]|uniref:uncharacterized protein LOC109184989 n=1 Tax=Ipomoea nil TaxID=35883 RepID=UPI000901EDE1|nr:PREDICTED: uncharacterized protein LOC109184989 [Ipomoea nil]
MSTLSWKCRGLGNPRTVREVVDIVSHKKPDFVYLMENKVGRIYAERLRIKLVFDGLFYVDNVRLSGGLALFWRKNNTARLLSFSKNHVDVEVIIKDDMIRRMTCFYGFPERNRRRDSWALLGVLSSRSALPWVVIGDFNDLLFQHEKKGGNPHPNNLIRGFGEAVEECGLMQLPMRGHQFTWEKSCGTENWIEERLDKVLATSSWCGANEGAGVENIMTRTSDHSALFLNVNAMNMQRDRRRRGFRFEMAWLVDEGYASARKKKNSITRLKNDDGVWVEGENMNLIILGYFKSIFDSSNFMCNDLLFDNFAPRVSPAQNDVLLRPFEPDEVKLALFSMFPDKAPGPDGMNPGFYQHFWDVVGADVSAFIVNSLNSCAFPEGLSDTNVILIPKKNVPERVSDVIHIALGNVLYRIMAKMIANRMKPLMGEVISESIVPLFRGD